jgi:predicted nucleic acid-binding protein
VLVLDANVVVAEASTTAPFVTFGEEELVAPPLMWSEARSSLREAVWRGEVPPDEALVTLDFVERGRVRRRDHRRLGREAWRIAEELGWAKTYDAEYLALASLLGARFVTLDARLRRGANQLGFVVSPAEL